MRTRKSVKSARNDLSLSRETLERKRELARELFVREHDSIEVRIWNAQDLAAVSADLNRCLATHLRPQLKRLERLRKTLGDTRGMLHTRYLVFNGLLDAIKVLEAVQERSTERADLILKMARKDLPEFRSLDRELERLDRAVMKLGGETIGVDPSEGYFGPWMADPPERYFPELRKLKVQAPRCRATARHAA